MAQLLLYLWSRHRKILRVSQEAEVALRKYLTAGEKNLKFRVRFLARARRLQKMLSALDAFLSLVLAI